MLVVDITLISQEKSNYLCFYFKRKKMCRSNPTVFNGARIGYNGRTDQCHRHYKRTSKRSRKQKGTDATQIPSFPISQTTEQLACIPKSTQKGSESRYADGAYCLVVGQQSWLPRTRRTWRQRSTWRRRPLWPRTASAERRLRRSRSSCCFRRRRRSRIPASCSAPPAPLRAREKRPCQSAAQGRTRRGGEAVPTHFGRCRAGARARPGLVTSSRRRGGGSAGRASQR
jgi:hypothetical protein